MTALRILHVHSTFSRGGKELRCVRLLNAFGDTAEHVVLSGVPGALDARDAIDPAVRVAFPQEHPPLSGRPSFARYRALARYMAGFDLVLTYNWGAMDAVAAHRLFAGAMRLPPLVHHEDGFNQDEAEGQKPVRMWFRRVMLPTVHALVVPSETLRRIARETWRQEALLISNGIDLARLGDVPPRPGGAGRIVVGTLAGLRPIKNLPRLVRAFARSGIDGDLVIAGEGPERAAILAQAAMQGISDRVRMPGHLDPCDAVSGFDVFALSSDSEQQPISLIEAMAAGLPVVATDVGDVATMVAPANRPFIVAAGDEAGFAAALRQLAADPALRGRIGSENRIKALQNFDERRMIEAYRALYAKAVGRGHALG